VGGSSYQRAAFYKGGILKVILNSLTNYKKKVLNIGDIEDVELRVADRWIKLGLAHLPAQGGIVKSDLNIPVYSDLILNGKQQEALKKFAEKIPEETIFREPEIKEEIKEIDIIEPVPVDNYIDFETKVKPVKKAKKIKNK
jgi:hypothetical protein